ncbi:ATP-binding cassette domain-containing protein [Lacticaseibacillus rhamnosus]|uniref:ATP-binding cassette domain-containing protein n=1 Tax=Lacticaseibacillus rhamnosus TaxID=47715 RepID=UPI0023E13CE9|nr:ATP-binding cassette domain-containing protein [Lacticaseibacillus rhamnosus]MDF3334932.1 ATP-binding cassette domain-containing protein [Lacticaseibacillus rhamnosus]
MRLYIENIHKHFGKKPVLNGMTATLESGGVIGLMGPNGAGKSTLLKVLTTQLKPDAGSIQLDHVDVVAHPGKLRQVLGYLPQQVPYQPNVTALDYLRYIAALKGIKPQDADQQITNLFATLHLDPKNPTRLRDYSGGMRQRVGLTASLLGDPQIIMVDEPTVGLDPVERIAVRNLLSTLAQNRIVLIATHIIQDVEAIASRLLIVKDGQFQFQGTPADFLQKAAGHVWEYVLPRGAALPSSPNISNMQEQADGIHVRQIAKTAPVSGARNVTPSLEDATLANFEAKAVTDA